MKILSQVTFSAYRPRKDKSCSFSFNTDLEVTSDQIKTYHDILDTRGVLYFKSDGNLTEEEVKEIDKANLKAEGKSKSQRLRNVLFVYYSQKITGMSFNEFYASEMERIIQHYKDKLEP